MANRFSSAVRETGSGTNATSNEIEELSGDLKKKERRFEESGGVRREGNRLLRFGVEEFCFERKTAVDESLKWKEVRSLRCRKWFCL